MHRALSPFVLGALLVGCGGNTSDNVANISPGQAGSGGASQGGSASVGGSGGSAGSVAQGGVGGSIDVGGAAGVGGISTGAGGASGTTSQGGHAGVGEGGFGGITSGGAGGVAGSTSSYLGSYTLVFQTETFTQNDFPGTPISVGFDTRVDLRMTANGLEALFTPSFQDTQVTPATASTGTIELSDASLSGGGDGENVNDQWTSLELALGADGSLTGKVSATGMQTDTSGDEIFSLESIGTATIVKDHVAPEFAANAGDPGGPPNGILPWDLIELHTSEGVDGAALVASSKIVPGTGEPTALAYGTTLSPAASDPTAWGGARLLSFYALSWEDPGAAGVRVFLAPGVQDLVGNQGAALTWVSPVINVGAAKASHDFEGDVVQEAAWGTTLYLGSKSGADPHCETGSCVELGPLYTTTCVQLPTGVAGRLVAVQGDSVAVRYRIDSPGLNGSAPGSYPPAFEVVLAGHDGVTTVTPVMLESSAYTDQGAAMGDARFTTGWRTDVFPITGVVPSGEAGFEVRATYESCGGGLVPPSSPLTIYLGSVAAQH